MERRMSLKCVSVAPDRRLKDKTINVSMLSWAAAGFIACS